MGVLRLIQSDYREYRKNGSHFFGIVFFTQGFWACFQYRIAHSVHTNITWQPFRAIFLFFIYSWQKVIEMTCGISVPAAAKIGHSLYIGHFGGIILNCNAVIGNHCHLAQGVTIGVSGTGENRGVPIIGDYLYAGANSVIAGKIKIGNNVLVGACSLVTTDVPDNSVMLGVPAVAVSQKGSKGYI